MVLLGGLLHSQEVNTFQTLLKVPPFKVAVNNESWELYTVRVQTVFGRKRQIREVPFICRPFNQNLTHL